jgi:prepilin-type N-terminal cleavage/methylation domain-containing protein
MRNTPLSSPAGQQGFTLLEVILALTITAFVVGGLMTLSGGSKQLAWRSQESLNKATELRAQIHFALLEDEYGALEPILPSGEFTLRGVDLLPAPSRKTQGSIYGLQAFEVINEQTQEVISGNRWVRFDLPR